MGRFYCYSHNGKDIYLTGIHITSLHENDQVLMEKKLSNKQLHALNNGDADAFSHLYKEWYKPLCFFAFKITGSKEDAEDIVVNMFTHFYHAKNRFEHVFMLENYLYSAVRNSCINHIKKAGRQTTNTRNYAYLQDFEDNNTIENIIIKTELLREILAEVKKLPDSYRDVFELSMQGLKNDEIARRLNITPTNVTTRKNRAINQLRLKLSKDSLLLLYIILFRSIY